MKIINEEEFGLLYDKLYEYLQNSNGNITGTIRERGEVNRILTQLWYCGKTWDTITLIIAYYNSRKDSLVLKISNTSTIIPKGSSFGDIRLLLGIKLGESGVMIEKEECIISEDEFTKEYKKLESIVKDAKTKKEFTAILEDLNITSTNRRHLYAFWKCEKVWEVVVSLMILIRVGVFRKITVDTDKGEIIYKGKEQDCFLVLEKVQNALINP